MALVARNAKEQLKIEIGRSSSRQSVSSGSSSPKLLSPKDKKARNNFVLSPAMGTELERLKQTYTPVEKILKPPPEERTLLRSFSTNSYNRKVNNSKFRSIGGKVANLLRVRKAFATSKKDEDDIITSNKHLPKEPRFSSSLSAAAQYAMMKGYEDAVYENLCKHYPASKLFLKRSKTPPKSYIDIGDVEKLVQPSIPEDRQIESESTDQFDSNVNKPESIVVLRRRNGKTTSFNNMRASISIPPSSESKQPTALLNRRATITRTKSMPLVIPSSVVPRQKRLILSHRLQSAMDILDTVRGNVGENSISPRINSYPRKIQPVSDFNQWSSIWSAEFKISRTGKT